MTINKAQGQTLDFVGIYLKESVFSHGQLYVTLPCAKRAAAVKVLIKPAYFDMPNSERTKNIVYREVKMPRHISLVLDIKKNTKHWNVIVQVIERNHVHVTKSSKNMRRILATDA
ncbi:uncharacterized protein LOC113782485 [Coffea eugenioides]|uniref:uncharacterized protein LOC113782485 n=1 Tax=Coffea eugenioides TaxID=49369 RepID=UPI000F60780D|nr:uncharacterized protein LOC113782485 [Coffea eugenioides]